jgi:type IV pilus assembly protein PilB
MRLLRSTNVIGLDKIGIPMSELSKFIKAIESPQGMVLVTGPTGSGKTTTLYAALAHLNKPELNILTAEDPVEYTMEGIGQIQANEGIGLSFANILRAFLRQDPEVILVGEIRDKETVDIAIKAAITGHLLLSTLHTNDAIQTIVRLTNMGVPNFMIAGALNTIVAQRLARKICADCKQEDDKITKDQLKDIGYTLTEVETLKIYKGAGCQKCNNTGYKGRQGIYEILDINGEIQNAIIEEKRAPEILVIAKKNGFRTMDQVARDHIKNGIITYEEFLRTISIQG